MVTKVYTTSKFANYTHVHMYAVHDIFSNKLRENGLSEEFYKLDADIDGNVVTWSFETDNKSVLEIFANVINEHIFSNVEVKTAVQRIAKKNSWSAEILDLEGLTSEVNKIELQKEKPSMKDDSLNAPYLKFKK